MIYFFLLVSLLLLSLLFKYKRKKNILKNNSNLYFSVIDKLNDNNEILKINKENIENLYYCKKCSNIHLEIIEINKNIIETSSTIKGKINYTFLPNNMEKCIIKKYFNLKVSHEIMSEINTLNTIYNINIEIKKKNKIIIKGFLNTFIQYYRKNNKFIIDIYRNKYIIDESCIITIYEIKFFHNKLNIF